MLFSSASWDLIYLKFVFKFMYTYMYIYINNLSIANSRAIANQHTYAKVHVEHTKLMVIGQGFIYFVPKNIS